MLRTHCHFDGWGATTRSSCRHGTAPEMNLKHAMILAHLRVLGAVVEPLQHVVCGG